MNSITCSHVIRAAYALGPDANPDDDIDLSSFNTSPFSSDPWKLLYLCLLNKVLSYIPKVKDVCLTITSTPEEAIQLLIRGDVSLVVSPTLITRKLLERVSAIGISCADVDSAISAYTIIAMEGMGRPLRCRQTFTDFLDILLIQSGNQTYTYREIAIIIRRASERSTRDYRIIVNTREQEEFLNEISGIPLENIIVDPTVPQTQQQISDLLDKYAVNGIKRCDIVYFGYYPSNCPAAIENLFFPGEVSTDFPFINYVNVILPPELSSSAFGWLVNSSNTNLLLWLQLAYDRAIKDLNLTPFYPTFENISSIFGCCTFSNFLRPSSNVGAFGPNVAYNSCLPFPFLPLPMQYSLCQRYIPVVAIYEELLPSIKECKKSSSNIRFLYS